MTKPHRTPKPSSTPGSRARYPVVDAVRGLAILLMFIYHFSYDLTLFELVRIDFYSDPFWLNFRVLIVSLFLSTVGVSLHLATRDGLDRGRYLRRLGLLVLYAGLVSLGSYLLFAERFIFFGILHFIALASVLGLACVRLGWVNAPLGIALLVVGASWSHPFFDQVGLRWIGLMTHKPPTEDYVPLLPWFGLVLLGIFIGQQLFRGDGREPALLRWAAEDPVSRTLRLAGRHSLTIYMLHQPVFLGLIYAGTWVARQL
jgi:uncharacterized membrane protein